LRHYSQGGGGQEAAAAFTQALTLARSAGDADLVAAAERGLASEGLDAATLLN
jgi:hypothetical protein